MNNSAQQSKVISSLLRFDLSALAKSSGWASRKSGKISPLEFCAAMIEATCIPTASLRIVAFVSFALSSVSVSKQAFHKRINARARKFFESLLGEVVSSKLAVRVSERKLGFGRIIVQDSTSIALPQHLFEVFKGAKNASSERPGLKVHASFDLVGKRFTSFEIREQRSADQGFALEGVAGLGEGDLMLRDLGYFCIESFRELERSKAHVLTRMQPKVELADPDTLEAFNLLELLRSASRIDRAVLVGKKERFPMRLIAFRVPPEVAERRRRRVNETAKRKGRTASRELLELQDWQIYLTTCGKDSLSFDDAFALYRQRWTIELMFKGFKSHMRIDKIPPYASESMVRCLILCALIRVAQSCVVILPILESNSSKPDVSVLKFLSLLEALGSEPDCAYFESSANFENFIRHCCYDKRKKNTLPQMFKSLG